MTLNLLHGGALDQVRKAFPGAPEPWIDLSTGINPWPYPPKGINLETLHHLPTQAAYEACRHAMAEALGTPAKTLCLAPGSELLIRLLPTIITPKRVAILNPSYGDHERAWVASGCELKLTSDPLSYVDWADAIVLCNPNNPDGIVFSRAELCRAHDALKKRKAWLIVDEAYADLSPSISLASLGGAENLILFRSFGKFFGLAGLRLGAMIAPTAVLQTMQAHLGVWPISSIALEIGKEAYQDLRWQEETRRRLSSARASMDRMLAECGLSVSGGSDLFRYTETRDADSLWKHLAQSGIYTRRFDWSTRHLRFGLLPSAEAEERLRSALGVHTLR